MLRADGRGGGYERRSDPAAVHVHIATLPCRPTKFSRANRSRYPPPSPRPLLRSGDSVQEWAITEQRPMAMAEDATAADCQTASKFGLEQPIQLRSRLSIPEGGHHGQRHEAHNVVK